MAPFVGSGRANFEQGGGGGCGMLLFEEMLGVKLSLFDHRAG